MSIYVPRQSQLPLLMVRTIRTQKLAMGVFGNTQIKYLTSMPFDMLPCVLSVLGTEA